MKKAGQIILEHDAQRLDLEDDIIEYRRAMEPQIWEMILNTVEQSKNSDLYKNKNFYIVLLQSVDRVLRQPRNVVLARLSCPTPVYKQSVWKYQAGVGNLEFLWSIPDALLYYHILRNTTTFLADKETADIAKFVVLMESGDLLEWVKTENGEKKDAVIHIDKETACPNLSL